MKGIVALALVLLTAGVSAQSSYRLGPQTGYVMPVVPASNPTLGWTDAAGLDAYFNGGAFNHWFEEQSDGRITFGPWTVLPTQVFDDRAAPLNPNDCPGTPNTLVTFASDRITALFGSAPQIRFFTWFQVILPMFGCRAGAGGGSVRIYTGYLGFQSVLHEMGHTLSHPQEGTAQHCTATGCVVEEYADVYTEMGDIWGAWTQYSASHKAANGWINGPYGGTPGLSRIQLVTTSGDYQLDPFERGPKGRVVALQTQVGGLVELEARVDGSARGPQYAGVIFRLGDTLMDLDTGPSDKYYLQPGQSFTYSGITYTVVSFGPTGAVVRIAFPGAPGAPPLGVSNIGVQ